MMTRKHYKMIADVIAWVREIPWVIENEQASTGIDVCDKIAKELTFRLAMDNPRFKRGVFLDACGIRKAQ